MINKHNQKDIITRKNCICNNKLRQKINFGRMPLINNYKTKTNLYDGILQTFEYIKERGSKPFDYHINLERLNLSDSLSLGESLQ